MIIKERKSPHMPLLTIPCADQRQGRICENAEAKINLCNTVLQTPRLSLIPITKIASIQESLSDPMNDYVRSKGLAGWKLEFDKLGYGLWCIHTDSNEGSSYSSSNSPRLSLNFTDDFNFKLPPSSSCSSISSCSRHGSLPIGYIHLSQESFINIGIFKSHTSQGYATEALKKLLSIIFDQDLTSGVVNMKVEDDASARVAEKLGFRKRERSIFSISKAQFTELWNSDVNE